ncbi:MAG: SdrD B-like domain-containing protein [Granulosicoccus sp.]
MRYLVAIVLLVFGALVHAAPEGCIGNRVWLDANEDGLQQTSESGIAGVKIVLSNAYGVQLDSAVTQKKGFYSLCGRAGTATLRVKIPDALLATTSTQGSNVHVDSNVNQDGVASVLIVANKKATHADIGLIFKNLPTADQTNSSPPVDTPDSNLPNSVSQQNDLRYGVWVEPRNAMPATADEGVTAAFPQFDFAHVRGKSLTTVGGDQTDPEYVVNILSAAKATNTVLDLQLGSSQDYGWNFETERGNFSFFKWKRAITEFFMDSRARASIESALTDGTIRYIFLIDEPHHSRWATPWNGANANSGNTNHITNANLDAMAAHVKSLWGNSVRTIVRASPVRLIQQRRGGVFRFQHLTHAYLSPGPSKWLPGNPEQGKGFEWWLRQKNNHTGGLTNCNAYPATNLSMAVMLQWGFKSRGNPYTGSKDWEDNWWEGSVQYPYRGKTSYVKAAPLEMDYIAKHFMIKRDPNTCEPSETGKFLVDSIVSFRWDRLPTDGGKMPMSSYPHYVRFHEQFSADVRAGNSIPHIGIPVARGAR